MTEKSAEEPKNLIDWVKSPNGVFETYANTLHLNWSLDDVRLRLGQVINSPDTPNPGPELVAIIEERAAVTFSWRNAIVLRDQLSLLIDSYERVNGLVNRHVKLAPPAE